MIQLYLRARQQPARVQLNRTPNLHTLQTLKVKHFRKVVKNTVRLHHGLKTFQIRVIAAREPKARAANFTLV